MKERKFKSLLRLSGLSFAPAAVTTLIMYVLAYDNVCYGHCTGIMIDHVFVNNWQ